MVNGNILGVIAKLKEKYPEDIARISAEEDRVFELLKIAEFSKLPITRELVSMCKREVVMARKKLATDKSLLNDIEAQKTLWSIIDGRLWFIKFVSVDYETELQSMADQLEGDLED